KPPPELKDGDEEWEVEEVMDSRVRRGGQLEFLVKWKEFYKWNPGAPHSISHQHFTFRTYKNLTTPKTPRKLFGWEDGKFDREYLEKLERNWRMWK
ncbi:hypothetical protein AMATHDRAFT_127174, partial [Amanita thiersii Skay4041]